MSQAILRPLLAAAIAAWLASAQAATIYVPDDYPTIQMALDVSKGGDTIIVRPGTYKENIAFHVNAVTLASEIGPVLTIIDGNHNGKSAVTFDDGWGADAVIDGFTIRNGYASEGAAIYCRLSAPTISNNIVTGNSISNYGDESGVVHCMSAGPSITGNTISDNDAGGWAAISVLYESSPLITWNTIANTAGMGIYTTYSGGLIAHNVISSNSVAGIVCDMFSGPLTRCNLIIGNGGGISCGHLSEPLMVNNTIAFNASYGVGSGADTSINVTNSIIWGNPTSIETYGGYQWVTYCDVQGGWSGEGNIDADPFFVDPTNGDFHLTCASPCRNAADPFPPGGLAPHDFEGDPLGVVDPPDIGADEFHPHLYHTGSVIPGAPIDIRVIGPPGSTPVTLALGSGIQDPPYHTQHGDFFLKWPPVSYGPIGTIPGAGVLLFPATTPGTWLSGEEHPLQALLGPFGGADSVLTNLMVLRVE